MERPQHWQLVRTAPARADAEGLFVPVHELPDAHVGDTVLVTASDGAGQRVGTIVAATQSDGAPFFRLRLDPSSNDSNLAG